MLPPPLSCELRVACAGFGVLTRCHCVHTSITHLSKCPGHCEGATHCRVVMVFERQSRHKNALSPSSQKLPWDTCLTHPNPLPTPFYAQATPGRSGEPGRHQITGYRRGRALHSTQGSLLTSLSSVPPPQIKTLQHHVPPDIATSPTHTAPSSTSTSVS